MKCNSVTIHIMTTTLTLCSHVLFFFFSIPINVVMSSPSVPISSQKVKCVGRQKLLSQRCHAAVLGVCLVYQPLYCGASISSPKR